MLASLFLLSLSVVTDNGLSLESFSGANTPEDLARIKGMIKRLGPIKAGRLLRQQGLFSEGCLIPRINDLGSDTSFNSEGLVAKALNTSGRSYKIHDYNVVCLNQGGEKDKYTSTSIIVEFSIKHEGQKAPAITKHFHFLCMGGNWSAPLKPIDIATSRSLLVGDFTTPTRHDCQMCSDPKLFSMATDAEHCVECPLSCTSRRCYIDGKCCQVFDLQHKCASKCPENAQVGKDNQCRCKKGYTNKSGKCERTSLSCSCLNGGACTDDTGKCVCIPGFSGANCEKCILLDCLKCRFRKATNKAVCLKKKKRVCQIKFITEPPVYEELGCNPFEGSGFILQCAVEVPKNLKHKVQLTWRFVSKDGSRFDLDAPFLEDFIVVSKKSSPNGKKVHISSTVTASLLSDSTLFGFSVKDAAFKYLKGGNIYCEASMKGIKKELFPTNFLTMPLKNPRHLVPCSKNMVYATDTDKCAEFIPFYHSPRVSSLADDMDKKNLLRIFRGLSKDHHGHSPDHHRYYPDHQGHFADRQEQYPDHHGQYQDLQGHYLDHQGPYHQGLYPDHQGQYRDHEGPYPDHQGQYPDHEGPYPDHQGQYPDHPEQYPDHPGQYPDHQGQYPDIEGHYPDHQGQYPDHQGPYSDDQDVADYPDAEYFPDEAGVAFEGSNVDTKGITRSRVKENPHKKENSGFHPWIFALATIGAAMVLVAVAIPLIMVGLHAQKKYNSSTKRPAPLSMDSNTAVKKQLQTVDNSDVALTDTTFSRAREIDSMISQARKESPILKK